MILEKRDRVRGQINRTRADAEVRVIIKGKIVSGKIKSNGPEVIMIENRYKKMKQRKNREQRKKEGP